MTVDLIEEAITEHWGKRCAHEERACPICAAWAQLDALRERHDKLLGVMRTYIDAPGQVRGSAYRDMLATLAEFDGLPCDYGWPAIVARLGAKIEELEAKRRRLPRTADGVSVFLYDTVWTRGKPFKVVGIMYRGTIELVLVSSIDEWSDYRNAEAFDCYSTEEAYRASLAKGEAAQ